MIGPEYNMTAARCAALRWARAENKTYYYIRCHDGSWVVESKAPLVSLEYWSADPDGTCIKRAHSD